MGRSRFKDPSRVTLADLRRGDRFRYVPGGPVFICMQGGGRVVKNTINWSIEREVPDPKVAVVLAYDGDQAEGDTP